MLVEQTTLPGVLILTPRTFGDDRGFFFESFNTQVFSENTGEKCQFVQDNHSKSSIGVLRGLHYQLGKPQGKLVRVVEGVIFDVAVDIRKGSPTFGLWVGVELTAENKKQLWVPPDFAHGFVVLSEKATFSYKVDNYYSAECDAGLAFNDPALAIDWILPSDDLIMSNKDKDLPLLKNLDFECSQFSYTKNLYE